MGALRHPKAGFSCIFALSGLGGALCRPGTTKGRTADAARPFGSLGCYFAAALSLEPADTFTE
jgi:hypothetical protein